MIATLWHDWLNPLTGFGYQFWSGIAGDLFIVTGIAVWWRRHNCHVEGCWRLQWHAHPVNGHPVCRRHHPHHGMSVAA